MLTNPETYGWFYEIRVHIARQKNSDTKPTVRFGLGSKIIQVTQIMDDWKDLIGGTIKMECSKNQLQ